MLNQVQEITQGTALDAVIVCKHLIFQPDSIALDRLI